MTQTRTQLWKGAVKSAVASATGLILSLPVVDPATFNIKSFGGWGHMGEVLLIVVVVAEARFWNQWASSSNGTPQ